MARDVRYGAAVYGSFLCASVVGISFEADESARTMTVSLLASMLIFWLAHAWSEVIGERVSAGPAFRMGDVLRIARREWPLAEAAFLPALLLALAWAGVWSRETGTAAALIASIVQITGWGVIAGRRSGATGLGALGLGAVEGALGVALLLLERLAH
jgi:hypothetical protein